MLTIDETLDLKKCKLPEGHSKFAPVPVAVELLDRAVTDRLNRR